MSNPRSRHLAICLVLVVATLAVYGRSFEFDFINIDDDQYVTQNPFVNRGLTADGVRWAFTKAHSANWHPLTWLSHMLDCELFGLDAGPHHAVNVLFHIANTLLLYTFLFLVTGRQWPSAIVGALFALHPAHVESVAWISERKDVLSTFFWMLTMIAYAHYVRRRGIRRYLLVLAAFATGLTAKQMLVTLPVVLLLLDFWPLGRFENRTAFTSMTRLVAEKLPLVGVGVAAGLVTLGVQPVVGLDELALGDRLANAVVATGTYVKMLVWPAGLAVFYPLRVVPLWSALVVGALLVAATVGALIAMRARPYIPVGWFWYLITLAPVAGVVQVGSQSLADRYTYVPYIGLFVIVVWGAAELFASWSVPRWVQGSLAGAVLVALSVLSWMQVGYWRDEFSVLERALAVTERNALAHNNLGQALEARGRAAEAERHYVEAIRLRPEYYPAYNNLGVILAKRGRFETAEVDFRKALELDPTFAVAWYNLGLTRENLGDLPGSVEYYAEAVRLKPDYFEAHFALADSLERLGRLEEAERHYRETLRYQPNASNAKAGLERVLSKLQR